MDDGASGKRFSPPRSQVADLAADDDSGELAGLGARLGAALIDMLVSITIYVAVMAPLYGLAAFGAAKGRINLLPGQIVYYLIDVAVCAWFLWRSSQSVGKIALGTRIVRPDGSRAGFVRTFWLRSMLVAAVAYIPYVGLLLVLIDVLFIFGPSRRCVHDLVADTIVVKVPPEPMPGRAPASA